MQEQEGGGSSSAGGSSSSESSSYTTTTTAGSTSSNPITRFLNSIIFAIIAGFSIILFRIKLMKAKRNSKKLMKLLDNKDEAWNYKNIQKQVKCAYFTIQNAWTNQNMSLAKNYMEEELYKSFELKIQWMQIKNRKNVLKKITLIEAIPVSIYNDEDDITKDYVWYYIKGSMIDYIIDMDTNLIVNGKDVKSRFIEYWKFVRKEDTKWVLSEILQANEKDKIVFKK